MRPIEWLTLIALLFGPLASVGITLWIEKRRGVRQRRLQIIRMLLATRHMPADPQYNLAINLIPAEFNDEHDVLSAWTRYHQLVREEHSTPETQKEHEKRVGAAQSKLIFETMRTIGLKLSECDIQSQAYVSRGFVNRDNLYLESLKAMREIAEALKQQVKLTESFQNVVLAAQRQQRPQTPQLTDEDGGSKAA
jgi:hypothetical protein